MLTDPEEHPQPASRPEVAKVSRLEDIWQQHASTGVSKQTSDLMIAGWSNGTTQHMSQVGSGGVTGVKDRKLILFQLGFSHS